MRLSGNDRFKDLVVTLLLSIACSAAAITVYHARFSQGTVITDIAGFVASQRNDYLAGRISAGELVENINGLVSEINAGKRNRVYIFDRAAGIAKRNHPVPAPAPEDDEDRE